jgi:hypothetical protein
MQLLKGLRILADAYKNQTWEDVREAYSLISGEELEEVVSDVPYRTVKAIKQAKKKLGRPKKVKVEERPFNPDNPGNFKSDMSLELEDTEESPHRLARSVQIQVGKNKFVDDGKLALEDKVIDKKLRKGWKKPERRAAHSNKKVACTTKGCKGVAQVDPSLYLTETSYYCDKCLNKKR